MLYNEQMLSCMTKENIEKLKIISYCIALLVKEKVSHLLYKINREQLISLYDECKIREIENKYTDAKINNFYSYYYKSLKAKILKGATPSFFMPANLEEKNETSEEDEKGGKNEL